MLTRDISSHPISLTPGITIHYTQYTVCTMYHIPHTSYPRFLPSVLYVANASGLALRQLADFLGVYRADKIKTKPRPIVKTTWIQSAAGSRRHDGHLSLYPPKPPTKKYARNNSRLDLRPEVALHRGVEVKRHLVIPSGLAGFPQSGEGVARLEPTFGVVRECFGRAESVLACSARN